MPKSSLCIYCNRLTAGVDRGEHILAKSLGGTKTIKRVCTRCNTGELSRLDKELVSRSPLQSLVQQFMGAKGAFVWGYCPDTNTALETSVLPGFSSSPLWPQLLLLPNNDWRFYADEEELEKVTSQSYLAAFRHHIQFAATTLLANDRRPKLLFEKVPRYPNLGHYPPRVFAQRNFSEFSRKMHFICRYYDSVNQFQVAKRLLDWDPTSRPFRHSVSLGVNDPQSVASFDGIVVARALIKLGINLLAYMRGEDDFNSRMFSEAISFVMNGGPLPPYCGFVRSMDIECLSCPEDCHRCELAYVPNLQRWQLLVTFFGGRMGAMARFPGLPVGDWVRTTVTIPIRSHKWETHISKLYVPRSGKLSIDPAKILATFPIRNAGYSVGKQTNVVG